MKRTRLRHFLLSTVPASARIELRRLESAWTVPVTSNSGQAGGRMERRGQDRRVAEYSVARRCTVGLGTSGLGRSGSEVSLSVPRAR